MKDKKYMKNIKNFLRCLILLAIIFFESSSFSAEPPRADLDESELYFTNAYLSFMSRNYWAAQNNLDRAISVNTYLVDFYLMNGLTLDRTGDGEAALSALRSYLEVRPMDPSVPRIVANLTEQDEILRTVIGTAPFPVNWRFSRTDTQTEWNTGYTRPFSIKGMGKVKALGETVCISDTFGDNIYVKHSTGARPLRGFERRNRLFREINVPSPVITIPMGDGTFMIFNSEGEIFSFANLNELSDPISPDFVGQIMSRNISDADIISENEFVVSDPVERNIAFYDALTLEPLAFWFPPDNEGDLLFEPVAVESFADWIAIADRANSRIYILNIMNREFFAIDNILMPRDIAWSTLGELFVLTERGEIYNFMVDFGTRTAANRNNNQPIYSNLENIWSIFKSPEGDLLCIDTGASALYRIVMTPMREGEQAFLGIYGPSLVMRTENRESFLINATFMSPFLSYIHKTRLIAQTAWNDKTMRASASWQRNATFDGMLIHRPVPSGQVLPLNLRPAQVSRGIDVRAALSTFWILHKDTLTNLVIDSSISFSIEDLIMLLRFCLLNGLELDIWAREVPSPALIRASAFTNGKTIYSLRNAIELPVPGAHVQIQIPLPQELSSSGYPGRSMLAVYLDSGLIQSRAWMPLWPDLFNPVEN